MARSSTEVNNLLVRVFGMMRRFLQNGAVSLKVEQDVILNASLSALLTADIARKKTTRVEALSAGTTASEPGY